MKHLIKVLFICFTSFAISVSIDSGAIFVHSSDKELTDAEVKKLTDDYYAEREKNRKNVAVTYKKEKLKNGVIYHYTVRNSGWDDVTQIQIGDMYLGEANQGLPTVYDIDVCAIEEYANISKIISNNTQMIANLENNDVTLRHCLVVDSSKNQKPLLQNQSITISVYLKKDDPKFANLHWVANFGTSENLEGSIKKAK